MCYDIIDDEYTMRTLDVREPIDRYVPAMSLMNEIMKG